MSNRKKPASKPALRRDTETAKVVLAYIHPGEVSSYFCQGLLNLCMYDQATDRRIVGCINEWSSANVSQARNNVTAQFVDDYPDADWLLWIDADMVFGHEALHDLLAVADPVDRPIVGGLCFGMSKGVLFPTLYQFVENEDEQITTMRLRDYPRGEVMRVAATGAAFLLIHRTVLESIRAQNFNLTFPWFQETELAGMPAGEDLTFCLRAGLCGYPVHVDTSIRIGHHKTAVLDEEMFLAQHAKLAEEERRGDPVPA